MKKIALLFTFMIFVSSSNAWSMWHNYDEDPIHISHQLSPQLDNELPQNDEATWSDYGRAFLQVGTLLKDDLKGLLGTAGRVVAGTIRLPFDIAGAKNSKATAFLTFTSLFTLAYSGSCWCYNENTLKWAVQYYMNTSITPVTIDQCSRSCGVPTYSEGSWLTSRVYGKPCPIPSTGGAAACWCYSEVTQKWAPYYPYPGYMNPTTIDQCSRACGIPVYEAGSFLTKLSTGYGQPCL